MNTTARDNGLQRVRSLTWGAVAGATVLAGFGAGFAAASRPAHHATTTPTAANGTQSTRSGYSYDDDGGATWTPPTALAPPSQLPSGNGTGSGSSFGNNSSGNSSGLGFGGGGGPAVSGAS